MNAKGVISVVLGVSFFCIFIITVVTDMPELSAAIPPITTAGAALWKDRTNEVVFQGIIILSGVISILLLLSPDKSRERPQ
jgi:hypothetical protein